MSTRLKSVNGPARYSLSTRWLFAIRNPMEAKLGEGSSGVEESILYNGIHLPEKWPPVFLLGSPDESGASHGYVAAGGPGFTEPKDTIGSHFGRSGTRAV